MKNVSPFPACERYLNGHGPRNPARALRQALDEIDEGAVADIYGTGALIADFERDIAKLLATQAAIFMPSGTMAQQIALRICCDRSSNKSVAMHATSHLVLHEENALEVLHGISPLLLGNTERLFTLSDLDELSDVPAAILWELPQREIGGQLPSWMDLSEQLQWAKDRGIHCHLDGARLWEAAPFYDRSPADIAALFDSVYVSFYKGLGGIAGAVLAGTQECIDDSRPWLRRHGGNLVSLYPYILSARAGLRRYLGEFGSYLERARRIAKLLGTIDGLSVVPPVPQSPMMHLHFEHSAEATNAANRQLAEEHGVMLFGRARPLGPDTSNVEISIGSACASISDQELDALFRQLVRAARC